MEWGESGLFPPDVLGAIERTFGWLCTRPHPVTVDGHAIAGLPDALVPLDEVRARLLDPATCPEDRDRVWAHLVRRARTDGPSWTVAAAGMAVPMLAGLARLLCARFAGDPSDVRSELVCGFVAALGTVDPDRHPWVSLRWAAYRSGHAAVREALDAPRPIAPRDTDDDKDPAPEPATAPDPAASGAGCAGRVGAAGRGRPESGPPRARPGHPDLVLARAVAEGVLTMAEAALIGSTRLEALTVAQAAAALGAGASTVWSRRYRAEARLVAHLLAVGPDPRTPTPTPAAGEARQRLAVRAALGSRTARRTESPTAAASAGSGTSARSGTSGVSRRRRRVRRTRRAGCAQPAGVTR